jgi:hypothetical protein
MKLFTEVMVYRPIGDTHGPPAAAVVKAFRKLWLILAPKSWKVMRVWMCRLPGYSWYFTIDDKTLRFRDGISDRNH